MESLPRNCRPNLSGGKGGDRVTQSPEQSSWPDLWIFKSKWEQLCEFALMDKMSPSILDKFIFKNHDVKL